MRVSLEVNGRPRSAEGVEPTESLLRLLREHLDLPGSKNACEQGECGSCAVYLDGVLVCSCLVLAAQAEGRRVVTIEGLAALAGLDGAAGGVPAERGGTGSGADVDVDVDVDGLDPVQRAFVEVGAVQCGFCTPGLVMAAHDLLRRVPDPDDDQIREALAGNVCRCTGYQKIIDAVHLAARG